jgi:hypothetical protein
MVEIAIFLVVFEVGRREAVKRGGTGVLERKSMEETYVLNTSPALGLREGIVTEAASDEWG